MTIKDITDYLETLDNVKQVLRVDESKCAEITFHLLTPSDPISPFSVTYINHNLRPTGLKIHYLCYKNTNKFIYKNELASTAKTPFEFADLDFTGAMAQNFKDGIKGTRTRDDWKRMAWNSETEAEYRGKLLRHFHQYQQALQSKDEQTAKKHLAAVACNANILWYHI